MPSSIRTIGLVAFGTVGAVLLVVSTFGYRAVRRSDDANRQVRRTYEVVSALEAVLTTLVDAETGTRGSGVTGLNRYLEPFTRAQTELVPAIDTVAALTVDNPIQQRRAIELRAEATATMRLLEQTVALGLAKQPIPLAVRDREKASMDNVRATLRQMRTEEQQLVEQRNRDAGRASTTTAAGLFGLVAVAFSVLVVSFLLVDRRTLQLRQAVRERTTELEQALVNEQQARRAAEQAQQRFERVVEGAPTAMVAVDKRGTIRLVNALTERLFGYTRGELVGKSVERLVPERHRGNHSRYRDVFSVTPQVRQMGAGRDLFGSRKDGSEVAVEIGLNPIDLDGEVLILSSIVDITDRMRTEEDRALLLESEQQAHAEADAANRSKDVFLARVSHELRTPLNALMGWTRMLRDRQIDGAKVPKAIASIDRNAEVLKTLVDDLVEMSRITTGKLQLDRRHLDLVAIVRESMNLLEPAANEKDIRVHLKTDSKPITVDADPTRLRQVFWNLLSNAIKFTPAKGNVRVHVRSTVSEVEISVADSGGGVAPDFLPHVFEPFAQADAGGQGLGLGLSIVQQLVKAHDGRISATSPGIGSGTTFTVFLRAVRVPETV